MKQFCAGVVLVALSIVPLRADITLTTTMVMEGQAAGMMGGQTPKITMRIKGMKSRTDIETGAMTSIGLADLTKKEVVLLQPQAKTAQVFSAAAAAAGGPALPTADVDASLKPTGKSQTIEGQTCDEHTFTMTLDMASLAGQGQVPPEAAAMMKDVKMVMNGSVWLAKAAPGAAEYATFVKAATEANLFAALSGMKPGQSGGLDKLMAVTASAPGLPYLTEIAMTFEGTGEIMQVFKQMGTMKMVQKISSVSLEPIADDLFVMPEGYTIEKK